MTFLNGFKQTPPQMDLLVATILLFSTPFVDYGLPFLFAFLGMLIWKYYFLNK